MHVPVRLLCKAPPFYSSHRIHLAAWIRRDHKLGSPTHWQQRCDKRLGDSVFVPHLRYYLVYQRETSIPSEHCLLVILCSPLISFLRSCVFISRHVPLVRIQCYEAPRCWHIVCPVIAVLIESCALYTVATSSALSIHINGTLGEFAEVQVLPFVVVCSRHSLQALLQFSSNGPAAFLPSFEILWELFIA